MGLILLAIFTLGLIIFSQIYKQEFVEFGNWLLIRYHKNFIYLILFFLSAVSSTLIPLPVWIYVFTSTALGFGFLECAVVIGLGSSIGSTSSYILGRYFSHSAFFKKKFDLSKIEKFKNRSCSWISMALFLGTLSPIPMDLFYAGTGIIHYPILSFAIFVTIARISRYIYLGYIFFLINAS